ncbi:MAG: aminopeptidase P N-terminal domain-containing protein [Proteobacteria bacterium]|nr:aminopeptidase P N-terminal domain-containing protein [Pseudomonadota bacterium]
MKEEHRQRRERFMKMISNSTAVFRSSPVAIMHNDVEYPYRQDSDFFYLTGYKEPEAVAVIAPHHDKHQFVLFIQPENPDQEIWTGKRPSVEEAKEVYGADEVFLITEIDEKLPQYLENADKIYYHFGRDRAFNEKVLRHWQLQINKYPKRGKGPIAIQDSGTILHPMRMVKSRAEIDLMRKAIAISIEAHTHARKTIRPGCYEYEIQAEIEYVFRRNGADSPAYPTIVASGPKSCILHYTENNRQLRDNDLILIDAGCSYGYYPADITRTIPVSGKFTPEQKAIYEIVLEAQKQAIAKVRPENTYQRATETAVRVITKGLVELGILSGDVEELINEEKYKPFFMHRIGHWIGLDVHDVGLYQKGEASKQFQPGNMLTVEPGIYIGPDTQPAEGQPGIEEKWRGIGIRIEDDVLVTTEGHEVLTSALPKSVDEIEQF